MNDEGDRMSKNATIRRQKTLEGVDGKAVEIKKQSCFDCLAIQMREQARRGIAQSD